MRFDSRQAAPVRLVCALLLWASPALAQQTPENAEQAVAIARYAFEYRDFEKVRGLLDPWLHPPRIVDPVLMIEARRLMGVSLHVLGQGRQAEEEFAQLLLLDPKHTLDPFVVPPEVIASFEAVRERMRPTLDEILARNGQAPPEPEPPKTIQIQWVELPHPAVALLPFGLPQLIQKRMLSGAIHALLQLAGLALNAVAFFRADDSLKGSGTFQAWRGAQYGGLALFLGSWAVSSVDAWQQIDAERQQLRAEAAPVATWQLRF